MAETVNIAGVVPESGETLAKVAVFETVKFEGGVLVTASVCEGKGPLSWMPVNEIDAGLT